MAQLENTLSCDGTVVSSGGFYLLANFTETTPESLQVCHRFNSIFHEPFHIFLKASEFLILNNGLCCSSSWLSFNINSRVTLSFSILDLFS